MTSDRQEIREREDFLAALNRLPEPDRTVLRLTFRQSLDFSQVAGLVDLPASVVRGIARRALVALKDQLDATR